MNYVDFLEESASSPSVPFMEFLRSQAPGTLHMFVEGESDIAFYRQFVLRYFRKLEKIHVHPCGGKDAVYKARRAIIDRATQPSWSGTMILLFFVDKDLSDILREENEAAPDIFVTDYYSVENYVVSEDMLAIMLSDMFSFANKSRLTPEEIVQIRTTFREQLLTFYQLIRPVMVWAIYHKRTGSRFEFDHINLNRILSFEKEMRLVSNLPSHATAHMETLDDMCGLPTDGFSPEAEAEISALIQGLDPKIYVRGKFELWFFCKFAEQVDGYFRTRMRQKPKYRNNLMSQGDLMISLGPRVHPIPRSLARFLKSNIREKRSTMQRSQS